MKIRHAALQDAAAIAAIYNYAVLHTDAIWSEQAVDSDNRSTWITQRQSDGYPVLIYADEAGNVAGYASYGAWRAFDGFRYTVEHSVYVHPDHQGKGAGRALLTQIIAEARQAGMHMMVAGITATNQPSLHLHRSLGFTETAHMPQVGAKFGRWLDLTFMQLKLDESRAPGDEKNAKR